MHSCSNRQENMHLSPVVSAHLPPLITSRERLSCCPWLIVKGLVVSPPLSSPRHFLPSMPTFSNNRCYITGKSFFEDLDYPAGVEHVFLISTVDSETD